MGDQRTPYPKIPNSSTKIEDICHMTLRCSLMGLWRTLKGSLLINLQFGSYIGDQRTVYLKSKNSSNKLSISAT